MERYRIVIGRKAIVYDETVIEAESHDKAVEAAITETLNNEADYLETEYTDDEPIIDSIWRYGDAPCEAVGSPQESVSDSGTGGYETD